MTSSNSHDQNQRYWQCVWALVRTAPKFIIHLILGGADLENVGWHLVVVYARVVVGSCTYVRGDSAVAGRAWQVSSGQLAVYVSHRNATARVVAEDSNTLCLKTFDS